MENQWAAIATVMLLTARALKEEWGCGVPPFDSLPNPALERQVDHWCRRLAGNLTAPIDPPIPVRPWVLARLGCAVLSLSARARGGIPCHGLSKDGIGNLLVRDWHAEFRDRWNLMVLEDLES